MNVIVEELKLFGSLPDSTLKRVFMLCTLVCYSTGQTKQLCRIGVSGKQKSIPDHQSGGASSNLVSCTYLAYLLSCAHLKRLSFLIDDT